VVKKKNSCHDNKKKNKKNKKNKKKHPVITTGVNVKITGLLNLTNETIFLCSTREKKVNPTKTPVMAGVRVMTGFFFVFFFVFFCFFFLFAEDCRLVVEKWLIPLCVLNLINKAIFMSLPREKLNEKKKILSWQELSKSCHGRSWPPSNHVFGNSKKMRENVFFDKPKLGRAVRGVYEVLHWSAWKLH